MDGPRAFAALDGASLRRAVIFLDYLEYDSAVATRLAVLASRRREGSFVDITSFRQTVPPGVDVILFTLDPPTEP